MTSLLPGHVTRQRTTAADVASCCHRDRLRHQHPGVGPSDLYTMNMMMMMWAVSIHHAHKRATARGVYPPNIPGAIPLPVPSLSPSHLPSPSFPLFPAFPYLPSPSPTSPSASPSLPSPPSSSCHEAAPLKPATESGEALSSHARCGLWRSPSRHRFWCILRGKNSFDSNYNMDFCTQKIPHFVC